MLTSPTRIAFQEFTILEDSLFPDRGVKLGFENVPFLWLLNLGVPGSCCQLELSSPHPALSQILLEQSGRIQPFSCHPFPSPSPGWKSPTENSDCLVLPGTRAKVLRPTLFLNPDLKTHLDWAKYSFSSSFETVKFHSYTSVSYTPCLGTDHLAAPVNFTPVSWLMQEPGQLLLSPGEA